MNRDVFITCAVTGAGDNFRKNPNVPISPEQIAESAIKAAKAGAAIVHCHVRDPESGAGSRRLDLYKEVVERIRASEIDVIINLTAGMGGDLEIGAAEDPFEFGANSDLVCQQTRIEHVAALRPEICTLDCGSYNVGRGSLVYISTNDMIEAGAKAIRALGVKPELELFELGHAHFARQLHSSGEFEDPTMVQICLGVPGAAPATPEALMAMRSLLPSDCVWSAFGVGAMQMPMVSQAVVNGGHVRVGLEDNIYLSRGVPATNEQLVERARQIIELMGAKVMTPGEVRKKLKLTRR